MTLRNRSSIAALVAGCLTLAGISYVVAQQPRKDAPRREDSKRIERKGNGRVEQRSRTETRSQTSTQILQSRVITGTTVNLSGGVAFGDVYDFVFNPDGCVDFVVVAYEDRYYPVPWVVASYNFDDRILLLDVDQNFMQGAPTFTEITELSDTRFVENVNTHYKVDERRLQPRPDSAGDRARSRPGQPGDKRDARPEGRAQPRQPDADKTPRDERPGTRNDNSRDGARTPGDEKADDESPAKRDRDDKSPAAERRAEKPEREKEKKPSAPPKAEDPKA